MIYDIPGYGRLDIQTIILDLNGTLSVGGIIPNGVSDRLAQLREKGFSVVLFTGNTRNDADEICGELGIDWKLAQSAVEKANLAKEMDPEHCATIGNGRIDLELFKTVKLGIVTLQGEGIHTKTLLEADIAVPNILDALDLFIDEQRMIATLRS